MIFRAFHAYAFIYLRTLLDEWSRRDSQVMSTECITAHDSQSRSFIVCLSIVSHDYPYRTVLSRVLSCSWWFIILSPGIMSATKRNSSSTSSTNTTSPAKVCCFCNLTEDNELEYGKLYEQDGIVTHYYCLVSFGYGHWPFCMLSDQRTCFCFCYIVHTHIYTQNYRMFEFYVILQFSADLYGTNVLLALILEYGTTRRWQWRYTWILSRRYT